jgi:hypothetical protein
MDLGNRSRLDVYMQDGRDTDPRAARPRRSGKARRGDHEPPRRQSRRCARAAARGRRRAAGGSLAGGCGFVREASRAPLHRSTPDRRDSVRMLGDPLRAARLRAGAGSGAVRHPRLRGRPLGRRVTTFRGLCPPSVRPPGISEPLQRHVVAGRDPRETCRAGARLSGRPHRDCARRRRQNLGPSPERSASAAASGSSAGTSRRRRGELVSRPAERRPAGDRDREFRPRRHRARRLEHLHEESRSSGRTAPRREAFSTRRARPRRSPGARARAASISSPTR